MDEEEKKKIQGKKKKNEQLLNEDIYILTFCILYRTDPSIPTRPAGQRPPPLRDPNQPGTSFFGQPFRGTMYNAGSNVAISAGIGLFPLGITLVCL